MKGRIWSASATLLLALCATASASDVATPAGAASGFYAVYGTFHPSDGIPDGPARARYQPYLSRSLEGLLADADAAESRFTGKHKDSPPLIEGDLFSANFEGATTWTVRKCEASGSTARCTIDLTFDPRDAKQKQAKWSDSLYLVRDGGWRVNDIAYGASAAFGNKGRLSDTLKEAVIDAGL